MAAFALALSGLAPAADVATPTVPAIARASAPASRSTTAPSTASTAAPRASIDALAWLAGHWVSAQAEETWLAPRGGLMLAVSREIRAAAGGTRVSFEYLRIEERDGTLVLQASPGGKPPTPFALAEIGPSRVRFGNAAHDFPQQITYWRDGERLRARVEGVDGGRTVGIDYAWTRAPAAPSSTPPPGGGPAPQ